MASPVMEPDALSAGAVVGWLDDAAIEVFEPKKPNLEAMPPTPPPVPFPLPLPLPRHLRHLQTV